MYVWFHGGINQLTIGSGGHPGTGYIIIHILNGWFTGSLAQKSVHARVYAKAMRCIVCSNSFQPISDFPHHFPTDF